jgi:hypothetical protein
MLVLTRLIMREKSDYFGIFGPTNDLGFLTITREELLREAKTAHDFFGGEFADPLTASAGLIEVRVLDEAGIERAREAHDLLHDYPYTPDHIDRLREASNVLQRIGRVLMEVSATAEGGTAEVKVELPL